MFVIEFFLYYFALEYFLSYLDVEGCVEFCIVCFDECHADAFVDAEAVVSGCYFAHLFAFCVEDGVAVAWYGFVCEFYADEFLFDAVCFLFFEGFFADEFGFVGMFYYNGCVATYTSPPPTAEPPLKGKPWTCVVFQPSPRGEGAEGRGG